MTEILTRNAALELKIISKHHKSWLIYDVGMTSLANLVKHIGTRLMKFF